MVYSNESTFHKSDPPCVEGNKVGDRNTGAASIKRIDLPILP